MKIMLNRKFQAAAAAGTRTRNQDAAEETKTANQDAVEETKTWSPAVLMNQPDADAVQTMTTIITTMIMTMLTWSPSKTKMEQLKSIPS